MLSDVLEVEMKAAYDELWLEVTLDFGISLYLLDYILITVSKMHLKHEKLMSGFHEVIKGAYLV